MRNPARPEFRKKFSPPLSDCGVLARPWGKSSQEVTMDSSKPLSRDERFAARKALLDQLARLREQFSAGWLDMELNQAFAAPAACRPLSR
jgi:hypothetical protein